MSKYKIKFEIDNPQDMYSKFTDYLDEKHIKYGHKHSDSPVVVRAEKELDVINMVIDFKHKYSYQFDYNIKAKIGEEWKEVFNSFMSLMDIMDEHFADEGYEGLNEEKNPLLVKIDQGINLTERELSDLIEYEVDKTVGENRRWTRSVESIVNLDGRYFRVDWEEGLTENQENEFYNQPVEVECREYQKTITVKEWIPLDKDNDLDINEER